MKYDYEITIAGVNLPLKTDKEENYVMELAAEMTKRINLLLLSGSKVTKLDAAIVCALDLLDENVALKAELAELKKENKA